MQEESAPKNLEDRAFKCLLYLTGWVQDLKVTFENNFKWSEDCNLITYINISNERSYHLELQMASALLELQRGEGALAQGLRIFLSHWQDLMHSGMSISGFLSPMSLYR